MQTVKEWQDGQDHFEIIVTPAGNFVLHRVTALEGVSRRMSYHLSPEELKDFDIKYDPAPEAQPGDLGMCMTRSCDVGCGCTGGAKAPKALVAAAPEAENPVCQEGCGCKTCRFWSI